jgi:hypothetical protein
MSGSSNESVRNTAADNQLIDDVSQRVEYSQFGRNFRAADNGDHGSGGLVQRFPQSIEFRCQQRPGAGNWSIPRNSVCARLSPVGGTERVHDEYVAKPRHPPRQVLVAGFFSLEKPDVFEKRDLARFDIDAVDPVSFQ